MKLTDIDLNDKTEVAAAHALLAAILGEAIPQVPAQRELPLSAIPTPGLLEDAARSKVLDAAAVFAQPGQLPADAQPLQDPAAVFGGQSATPLPLATGAPALASGLPSNGGTSAVPGADGGLLASVGLARAPGVELDSSGLPWDARIHAGTKSKKKDGTWTALRGLNDEGKVKQIEAELRATVQGQQPGTLPGVGLPGVLAGPEAFAQSVTPLPLATTATAPAGSTQLPTSAPAVAQPGVSADPVTFEQLMPRVTQATISGILPPTALQQVCGALGLQSVVALQTQPAYVPHAWAQLKAAYPALQ